ncbi:Hypothetical predicted protein [Podarcis lilfordi]|uniref:Uncharacterized protein n=1 Tax=Podarcis lilfordi TaxID=74358 RepID=A0AA35P4H7_9SAUR|nr:Hypothetical predicted protein [Podarcis lilfordi]
MAPPAISSLPVSVIPTTFLAATRLRRILQQGGGGGAGRTQAAVGQQLDGASQ